MSFRTRRQHVYTHYIDGAYTGVRNCQHTFFNFAGPPEVSSRPEVLPIHGAYSEYQLIYDKHSRNTSISIYSLEFASLTPSFIVRLVEDCTPRAARYRPCLLFVRLATLQHFQLAFQYVDHWMNLHILRTCVNGFTPWKLQETPMCTAH